MHKRVEDVFLDWKLTLDSDVQDDVEYQEYDAKLQMLFVQAWGDFDRSLLADLEHLLQKEVSPSMLVSSLVAIPF